MICPNCQKEIADGSKFCYSCGAQLAAGGPAAPHAVPAKRLMRSVRDKKIAGVCAGIAEASLNISTSTRRWCASYG
jgi:hypothetical protein